MMSKGTKYWSILIVYILLGVLTACNTGIESTKTIKMSRSEKSAAAPSAEQIFINRIPVDSLGLWKVGKKFRVVDNRVLFALESETGEFLDTTNISLKNQDLEYTGIVSKRMPDGKDVAVLSFEFQGQSYYFNTLKPSTNVNREILSVDLPMMVDMDIVNYADSLLKDRIVWTKGHLAYDSLLNIKRVNKFEKVRILSVDCGNHIFPLKIKYIIDGGEIYYVLMNLKSSSRIGTDNRTFDSLFSLTDPKLKYASISDDVWSYIQRGDVRIGMTKQECSLSLGMPTDIDGGHTWNNLVDIWKYKDGTFLQFEDGLLIRYRK